MAWWDDALDILQKPRQMVVGGLGSLMGIDNASSSSDLLSGLGMDRDSWLTKGLGFAGDVALDPLTYAMPWAAGKAAAALWPAAKLAPEAGGLLADSLGATSKANALGDAATAGIGGSRLLPEMAQAGADGRLASRLLAAQDPKAQSLLDILDQTSLAGQTVEHDPSKTMALYRDLRQNQIPLLTTQGDKVVKRQGLLPSWSNPEDIPRLQEANAAAKAFLGDSASMHGAYDDASRFAFRNKDLLGRMGLADTAAHEIGGHGMIDVLMDAVNKGAMTQEEALAHLPKAGQYAMLMQQHPNSLARAYGGLLEEGYAQGMGRAAPADFMQGQSGANYAMRNFNNEKIKNWNVLKIMSDAANPAFAEPANQQAIRFSNAGAMLANDLQKGVAPARAIANQTRGYLMGSPTGVPENLRFLGLSSLMDELLKKGALGAGAGLGAYGLYANAGNDGS